MSDDVTEMPAVPPMPDVPPLPDPSPARPPRRWVLPLATGLAGLVVGAAAVGAAWGLSGPDAPPPPPKAFTLWGSMTLVESVPLDADNTTCAGTGGYDDIVEGASVTVYDGSGKVVGTGSLEAGTYQSNDSSNPCLFNFAVADVPGGAKFYQVEISHRGRITVSAAVAKAGTFAASLG